MAPAAVRSGQTRPNTRRAMAKVTAALSPTAHRNVATPDLIEPGDIGLRRNLLIGTSDRRHDGFSLLRFEARSFEVPNGGVRVEQVHLDPCLDADAVECTSPDPHHTAKVRAASCPVASGIG